MSYTYATHFAQMVSGIIKVDKRWINRLNDGVDVEGGNQAGVISTTVLTTATASNVTPGTIPTNGINNSVVSLTVGDKIVPYVVKPSEVNNFWNKSPKSLAAIGIKAADSIMRAAESDVIAAIVAATPGDTTTMPSGMADFALTLSTATDKATVLRQTLGKAIGFVGSQHGGYKPMDIIILAAQAAYQNLFGLAGEASGLQILPDGTLTFLGCAIYPATSTTTNWGGATKECVFVCHYEDMALKMGETYIQGGGFIERSDGTTALHFLNPYFQGVANASGIAAIINGAS